MQTIYEVSTANGQITIYRRAYTVNGWQAWYKFEGTLVATASVQSASPSLMLNREELTQLETDEIEERGEVNGTSTDWQNE